MTNMTKIAMMLNNAYNTLNEDDHNFDSHARKHQRTMMCDPEKITIENKAVMAHILPIAVDQPANEMPIVTVNNRNYYKETMRTFVLLVTENDASYAIKKCDCYELVENPNNEDTIVDNIRYEFATLDCIKEGVWFISNI